jgi:hypothetical protein
MSAEQVRAVMEECTRLLMPDVSGRVLGCWGLIDADEITGIAVLIAIR